MELKKTAEKSLALLRAAERQMKDSLARKGKGNSRIARRLKYRLSKTEKRSSAWLDLPAYALYLDSGRKPGKMPPLREIMRWARRKGLPIESAYPIAKAIAKRGLPATDFLDPHRALAKKSRELSAAFAADAKKEIDNAFKESFKSSKLKKA